MPDRVVADYLPVKPEILSILLALGEGPQHGYGVIERVRARQGASDKTMHSGPFYRHLHRLLDDGLVQELTSPPRGMKDDVRRGPYYQLTRFGRAVTAAECARLEGVVHLGRRLGFGGKKA